MGESERRTFCPAGGYLGAVFKRALDFCLPPQCLSCGAVLRQHDGLCGECWRGFDFISDPQCSKLGIPFPVDPGHGALSPQALNSVFAFERVRAAVRFEGPARQLVHALKYGDRQDLAPKLAVMMRHAAPGLLEQADLIVPVPLHRMRLWRRRFNQAALLAQALANQTGTKWAPGVLRRVRWTPPQVNLAASQRRRNVAGAFQVPPSRHDEVAAKSVVLVDDVLTTGATANACAKELRRAGARQVEVLTFARVVYAQAAWI